MKLKTIMGREIMGASFRIDLPDLAICFGSNDRGKTRLRNAITLLLLGYLPSLDKKPAAIFKLSSGRRMEVEGAFEDGSGIVRTWEEKGDNIKHLHHVPQHLEGKTPLVLLDAQDYFGRSARGRVEMVFSVANITDKKVEFPQDIAATIRMIAPKGIQTATTMQELIECALEGVEEARKGFAADVHRYTQTLQGVTALQLRDKAPGKSVEEIDEQIDHCQAAIAGMQTKLQLLQHEQEADEIRDLERERLQRQIEEAGNPKPRDSDIDELRLREKRIAGEIANEEGRKFLHDLWESAVAHRKMEIHQLETGLAAIVNLGIDRTLEPEVCGECGRPYPSAPPEEIFRQREVRRDISIQTKRRELLTWEAQPIPTEPAKPNDATLLAFQAELRQVRADIDEYTRTADVQVWRAQLAEIPASKDRSADIYQAEATIKEKQETLENLRGERRAAETERTDRKRLAGAQEEQEKAIANEARAKAAKKFLLEKKAELIKQVFGPLLEIAGRFTYGIFDTPIEYRDRELGQFVGSQWVTESTFGGAKRSMLYAALQAALGAQSPTKIILCDEMLNMVTHLRQFMENIRDAQKAGVIEQFLGLIPTGDLFPAERIPRVAGFELIEATGKGYETH